MRRRMLGIVAAVAFARMSFGGIAVGCDSAHAMKTHPHHVARTASTAVSSHHVSNSSCDDMANQAVCVTMSACVNALAQTQYASANIAPAGEVALAPVFQRFVNPSSAPEPPPPRA